MTIAVASGKGGTGKTTFSVNLAYALAEAGTDVRLLDCDVEEPNDHLFVRPDFTEETPVTVMKPVWEKEKCTGCGKCADACGYNAIAVVKGTVIVFNELCHGCGVCSYVCAEDALHEQPAPIGCAKAAPDNKPFFFAHGTLNIAEASAPTVVRKVKEYVNPGAVNIIDASPGTACPVVEAIQGADVAVLVTEPTPFGLNDLKLAVGLTLQLRVPTGIVVNRSDGADRIIADYADSVGIPILGRVPFRRKYAEVYSRGGILVSEFHDLRENLLAIYANIKQLKGTEAPAVPTMEDIPVKKGNFPNRQTAPGTYRELTVISGKGGTGKTTVVGSLAVLAEDSVLADNDVDAADLHLLLAPTTYEAHDFQGGNEASIDSTKCTGCGKCAELCHFDAIRPDGPANDFAEMTYRIDPLACEGCTLCAYVCPVDAVVITPAINGRWFVSQTSCGPMVHARLGIAEENSGKLVTKVRIRAAELAHKLGHERILGDGPPGTGCPVIASVSGADLVLIVTEPTVSGVHDMERVLALAAHFRVPSVVVINKADLNNEQTARIRFIAEKAGSRVIAHIPFDRNVNDALMAGKTVIEHGKGPACKAMHKVWNALQKELRSS